jgi:hypothetical protein
MLLSWLTPHPLIYVRVQSSGAVSAMVSEVNRQRLRRASLLKSTNNDANKRRDLVPSTRVAKQTPHCKRLRAFAITELWFATLPRT